MHVGKVYNNHGKTENLRWLDEVTWETHSKRTDEEHERSETVERYARQCLQAIAHEDDEIANRFFLQKNYL